MNRMLALAIALCLVAPTDNVRAATYRFDTVHTQIFFCVSHLGFSKPCGRLHVKSGYFVFDANDWTHARVDVTVDVGSVDMGDPRWNATVRSWQFFDTGSHPTAHFVSTRVEKTGDNHGIVHGQLSLHGVTQPLDLDVRFNRAAVDPYTFHFTAGFSVSATLQRSNFGMRKYLPDVVGDTVRIDAEVEGIRDRHARPAEAEKSD